MMNMDNPATASFPGHPYAEWISCEAYLGTTEVTDSECRAQDDLARLATDLYRQHLLRGKQSARREVYVRVTPQSIRLRVMRQGETGNVDELDIELESHKIARCSMGHNPFPQVVVIVYCAGLRSSLDNHVNQNIGSSSDGLIPDMRCHGIACADARSASMLAMTMSRAFTDSQRVQDQRCFIMPQPMQRDQRVSRNSVTSSLVPSVRFASAEPPSYAAHDFPPVGSRDCASSGFSGRSSGKSEKGGLPEVGAWWIWNSVSILCRGHSFHVKPLIT